MPSDVVMLASNLASISAFKTTPGTEILKRPEASTVPVCFTAFISNVTTSPE
jgi:hypothetical protein